MLHTLLGTLLIFLGSYWNLSGHTLASPPPGTSICPDGQGVNALSNGDFGSGVSNILSNDPGIAPGYVYTTSPPPNDGFYTITNNTAPWGSFATNWIDIRDNSPDPNGYMMVVNASFAPGIFYEQTVQVCATSEYQFSADIINLLEPGVGQQILPNVDFLVDGLVLFSTGNIPQNGLWQNVGFVFTTMPGQSSITIQIRNNAPGGIGNDLALDNISFSTCGPSITIQAPPGICDPSFIELLAEFQGGNYNDPNYQWQESQDGINWLDIPNSNNDTISVQLLMSTYFRLIVADGIPNLMEPNCRVLSTVVQVFLSDPEAYDTVTICEGDVLEIGDVTIVSGGTYDIMLTSDFGCDSLLHLSVSTSTPSMLTLFDTLCYGELYQGNVITESTTITTSFINSVGCDSTVVLNLFVDDINLIIPQSVTINQGDAYIISPSASGTIVQWNWTPDTFITCLTCPVTEVFPPFTTRYYLNVVSDNDCLDSASILVSVLIEKNIFIPSVFSPNNDGINDTFFPLTNRNIITIDHLAVYDRWGTKVYEVKNIDAAQDNLSWDGKFRGKAAAEGVYAFHASFTTIDGGSVQREGDILLIR